MLVRLRPRLTTANAVSTLALVLALTGGAYASGLLPKNSVGSAQLRKNSVTKPKIAAGAVDSSKVKNASLTASDFVPGALPAGPPGQKGDPGFASTPTFDYESATVTVPDNSPGATNAKVSCPPGQNVVGGGAFMENAGITSNGILDSYPDGRTGWIADGANISGTGPKSTTVYVMCTTAQTTTP
jgi:hypothetical protein